MIVAMQPVSYRMTVSCLEEGERLFLWCLRRWVAAAFRRSDAVGELRQALASHQLQATAGDVDDLLSGVSASARRTIDIRISGAMALSRDEVLFCRALSASADGISDLVDALMLEIVFPHGLARASDGIERIAAALQLAGVETKNWRAPRPAAGAMTLPAGVAAMPVTL
ncbi:MAG: hypothetical protein ACMVY4_22230 [Minwuia sp.]|uniref:hypothetical protein n=1 Tax=Minwuia sp. TaxID=2493630 RepID=UPI003A85565E